MTKKILIKIFAATYGRLIRFSESFLTRRFPSPSVIEIINSHELNSSAAYALKYFKKALQFTSREDLWAYCLKVVRNPSPKTNKNNICRIFEFGVHQGYSINFFARNTPDVIVFGFDSFEGLEENWTGTHAQKYAFNLNGNVPEVEPNVTLIKGWFKESLPKFIETSKLGRKQISLLHLDADTYTPTKYVLTSLKKNIRKGTIIIFDEYFGYTNWKMHEFKAFQEYVKQFKVKYTYLAYTNQQVAVEIL